MANEPKGKAHLPAWPTLEEQLVASKVIHGSALEKVIRAYLLSFLRKTLSLSYTSLLIFRVCYYC